MTQLIRIAFARCEDDQRQVEAKAVDVKTGLPLASLPRDEMAEWLKENGFEPKPAFMVWERAA